MDDRLRVIRNIVIVAALAAAIEFLPGGGRADLTISAVLGAAFGVGIGLFAVRMYQEHRTALYGLGDLATGISFGASPRASINLVLGAKALAFLRGRTYALPHDVAEIAPEVLRHRLVLSYDGIATGLTPETVVGRVLERYPPPWISLGDRRVS